MRVFCGCRIVLGVAGLLLGERSCVLKFLRGENVSGILVKSDYLDGGVDYCCKICTTLNEICGVIFWMQWCTV